MTFEQLTTRNPRLRDLNTLFSVVICVDRKLQLVAASQVLSRHMPSLCAPINLLETFRFQRPTGIHCVGDIERNLGSLFLMVDRSGQFAVRGQMIAHEDAADYHYVFCGAPWLFWIANHRPDLRLGLDHFSAQDAQIDQQFYMNTERRMVHDLERLNAELSRAKADTEQAQASRDQFFTRMSHEMRTPLNGVLSAITLMQDPGRSAEIPDLARLAGQSATNLLQVINYVLDVAKLSSHDGALVTVDFDLKDLLESVLDVVRARAIEKALSLDCVISDGVDSRYHGDANLLRQILLNLTMNAIKFTEEGGVALSVSASQRDAFSLRFEVRDSGIGIRKEVQRTIFEPFSTLHDDAPGTLGDGTGLGLDIVRRNTEALGGVIGVSSVPGDGSTFWLELPMAAASEEMPASTPRDTAAAIMHLRGRVLLVDDNATNRMLGAMLIESMGLEVHQASGGQHAIEQALGGNFDAVLMDISMPDIDGYAATRKIREHRSSDELPIIALTAYASDVERQKSRDAGMNAYLTKPIERDKLFTALAGVLAGATKTDTAKAAPTTTAPLISADTLNTLRANLGEDNFQHVVQKFLGEAPDRLDALLITDERSSIALQAHALAGMAASFGLEALHQAALDLETQAKSATGDAISAREALGVLARASFNGLREAL